MTGEALFIGWGSFVRGRERQALQLFKESTDYYRTLQEEGRIESFDVVMLAPHGGDLNGFVVLHGDRKALADVRFSDEFERFIARASAVVDSPGVVPAYTGEAMSAALDVFQEATADFA